MKKTKKKTKRKGKAHGESDAKNILIVYNLVFKLPDGFKGDFGDALILLARHLKRSKTIKQKKQPHGELTDRTWNAFTDIVSKGGRVAAVATFQRWNGKKWIQRGTA